MKKLLIPGAILLCVVMLLPMAACSQSSPVTDNNDQTTQSDTPIVADDDNVSQNTPDVDDDENNEQPTEENEPVIDDSNLAADSVETISSWLADNARSVAESISELLPNYLSGVRDKVASIIEKLLETDPEFTLESVNLDLEENRYSARIGIGFPFTVDLPLLGSKSYVITVNLDFTIDNGGVTDFSVDIPSFSIAEREEEPIQENSFTMEIQPINLIGESYHYRTILRTNDGKSVQLISLTREFIENGYIWTGDRDFILDRLGSYMVPESGELVWETAFDLSECRAYFDEHGEITYRESWLGITDDNETVSVSFTVSTRDF